MQTETTVHFTRDELMFLADCNNPGSLGAHAGHTECGWANTGEDYRHDDGWLALEIRANAEDSFRLYPGSYEEKWHVNRDETIRKLREAPEIELARIGRAIARFWDHCQEPDCEQKLIALVAA